MKIIYILIFLFGLFSSCKPTEKGYKSAYDVALGKRQSVLTDIDVNLPEGALQEVDGAQLKQVDGANVYILTQRISPLENNQILPENYNVAVGKYKMSTNCKAQVESLKNEGYEAFSAKDTEGNYYTIAGSFSTLFEAVKFYQAFQKNKNRIYVGLHEAPEIIYSPK